MPNHITNRVHAPKEVLDFMKSDESIFDFNNIMPMPPSLNINNGTVSDLAYALVTNTRPTWLKPDEDMIDRIDAIGKTEDELRAIGEQMLENERLYGAQTWYEWSCNNWGTKWNAYDIHRVDDNTIEFDTAWRTPMVILKALSEKFQDEEITTEYADEDAAHNCGRYVFFAGNLAYQYEPKGGSKLAYELYFDLKGNEELYEFNENTNTYEYKEED
jgi:hypothetical protein